MTVSETVQYMAIDQYGQIEHGLNGHPRKELMERLDRKRAVKMFRDRKDAPPIHTGYIVGGRWFTLYQVRRMENPA